jgi:hypothetical protein
MKKFSWIFALILALSIGFVGCPSGGEEEGGGDDGSGGGDGGGYVVFGGSDGVQIKKDGKNTTEASPDNAIDPGTIEYLSDGSGFTYTYGKGNSVTDANTQYGNSILRFKLTLDEDKTLEDYGYVTFNWQGGGPYQTDVNSSKTLWLLVSADEDDLKPYKGDGYPEGDPDKDKDLVIPSMVSTNYFDTNRGADDNKIFKDNTSPTVNGIEKVKIQLPILKKASLGGELWFAIYVHAKNGSYTISNFKLGGDPNYTNPAPGAGAPEAPAEELEGGKPVFFEADLSANTDKTPGSTGIVYDDLVITPTTGVDTDDGSITVKFTMDRQRLNIKFNEDQVAALLGRNKNKVKVLFDAEVVTDNTSVAKQLTKTAKIEIGGEEKDINFLIFKDATDSTVIIYKGTKTGDIDTYEDKYYGAKENGDVDLENEVTAITDESTELTAVMSNTSGDVFRYHLGDAMTGSDWNATSAAGMDTIANIKNATLDWTMDAGVPRKNPKYFILQHGNYSGGLSENNPSSSNEITIKIKKIVIGEKAVDFSVDFTTATPTAGSDKVTVSGTATNEFTYEQTADYGPFAYFKVTFPTDYILSDYAKLDITFEGLTGDTGFKDLRLALSKEAPTSVSESGTNGFFVKSAQNGAASSGAAAAKSDTITLPTFDSSIDLNEVYIAVYVWCESAKWKISGVKFKN